MLTTDADAVRGEQAASSSKEASAAQTLSDAPVEVEAMRLAQVRLASGTAAARAAAGELELEVAGRGHWRMYSAAMQRSG